MHERDQICRKLKGAEAGRGMTQEQLAALLGVDQRTVSAWENKICRPDYEMLAKLCDVFGEDFDSLLT